MRHRLRRHQGFDKFKDKPVESRTLCVIYPNLAHFVTMEGTGINKLTDIKGKRISTASPVSGSEVMALRIMEELGLKVSDIKRERLAPTESTNAMKDGKLDGYFFNGGPPVAAITDLAASQGIKIKLAEVGIAAVPWFGKEHRRRLDNLPRRPSVGSTRQQKEPNDEVHLADCPRRQRSGGGLYCRHLGARG